MPIPEHLSHIINELREDREHYFNAVAPPIVQTSNFAFKTVSDLQKVFEDEYSDYLYSRGLHPTGDILRKKMAALDEAEDCLLFNSGASAIFAAVLSCVQSGDHLISVRKPYTWAQKMFDTVLSRFGVTTTYVDGRNIENFERALKPNTKLIYLESPNSWDFALQDLGAVAQLAQSRNILTICDNSYCTPLYQKPIKHGIDLVLQSATKYIGGHSDVVAGILTGKQAAMKKIFDSELLNMGNGITPFHAWLLIRGLRTLPVRLKQVSQTATEVITFLKNHPKIEQVLYPLDPAFPQYALAQRQMTGAGGLFTVVLQVTQRQEIVEFCESLQHFLMAVSWGGHESLALPRCAAIKPEHFDPSHREHRMVRLYTGLEEAEFLIKDLNEALKMIQ